MNIDSLKCISQENKAMINYSNQFLNQIPEMSYYLLLFVARKLQAEGNKNKLEGKDDSLILQDLGKMINQLEQYKNTYGTKIDKTQSAITIQQYLDLLLEENDLKFNNGQFDQEILQNFFFYSKIVDVMSVFGELSEENINKSL